LSSVSDIHWEIIYVHFMVAMDTVGRRIVLFDAVLGNS
jgi:hypothetical protein